MGGNHRKHENVLFMAIPQLDVDGHVEGWYKFDDVYLSPEVRYNAWPPSTLVTIGGRTMEIDRAVPLKIRLLEANEDYHFWCKKKQHSQRINCGEYHKDFGDVEIGYSFSSPQTHIWFAGYAIHTECFENLSISSYNATVRVTPEHIIRRRMAAEDLLGFPVRKGQPLQVPLTALQPTKSLFEMVLEEGADFPVYTAALPVRKETQKGLVTELVPTAEFINDCERDIVRREAFDVGAAVAQISDPVSFPPTFPPVKPFEHSNLFWSFVYNKLLEQRLHIDDLEQAFKDIVLLNRYQQYDHEKRRHDRKFQQALDRLAGLFQRQKVLHKATWPLLPPKCNDPDCLLCEEGHHTHNYKDYLPPRRHKGPNATLEYTQRQNQHRPPATRSIDRLINCLID